MSRHQPIRRHFLSLLWLWVGSACCSVALAADKVYLETADFIAAAFPGGAPAAKVLWLTPDLRTGAARILNRDPAQLRQAYWSDGKKTAWILDEIGKEEPITAGFVVRDGKIEQARVLIYRESRGNEIRYPAFLNQFTGTSLADDGHLNRKVDGISGATFSVNSMVRMSRLALYYAAVTASGK